jgi:hypothetical protein
VDLCGSDAGLCPVTLGTMFLVILPVLHLYPWRRNLWVNIIAHFIVDAVSVLA